MPRLTIELGLSAAINPTDCYQIDMDDWGYSDSAPIGTTGAAPCLNVVVHKESIGCLSHIWNSTLNQTENYHKACFTIRDMILCMGTLNNLDIWLGAGHAFGPNLTWATQEVAAMDFPAYLNSFLSEMGCTGIKIIDYRTTHSNTYWDPGSIVYSPPHGKIYLLSNRDNDNDKNGVFAIQTGKKPKKGGRAK